MLKINEDKFITISLNLLSSLLEHARCQDIIVEDIDVVTLLENIDIASENIPVFTSNMLSQLLLTIPNKEANREITQETRSIVLSNLLYITEGSKYGDEWAALVKSHLGNDLDEDTLSAIRVHSPNRRPYGTNDRYLQTLCDKVKLRLSKGIYAK
jgi:hypothetical protein